MMNETVNEMQNEERSEDLVMHVFDVEYIDWDGSVEFERFIAEDEDHAAEKFEMFHTCAVKPKAIHYRGEA